jgi:hypothetical protein
MSTVAGVDPMTGATKDILSLAELFVPEADGRAEVWALPGFFVLFLFGARRLGLVFFRVFETSTSSDVSLPWVSTPGATGPFDIASGATDSPTTTTTTSTNQ